MPFEYTQDNINAIEKALSPERFLSYVRKSGGNREKALKLYERNTLLAEGLYGVVQAAEVALRNAIHSNLSREVGPTWFDTVDLIDVDKKRVEEARGELNRITPAANPPSGAIVAELRFGFWTSLLSARYEKALWVTHLHRAFPSAWREIKDNNGNTAKRKIDRADIHGIAEETRKLRNRIAHHEPISLKGDLWSSYLIALKLIQWICPASSEWVAATNCFRTRFHAPAAAQLAARRATPAEHRPAPGLPRGPE